MALAALLAPPLAAAQPATPACAPRGLTVAYFNGVWSDATEDGALSNLQAIRRLHGTSHRGEAVTHELFFNHTGGLQDLAEVFIQRADEFDQSGELARRWEYFWETATDGTAADGTQGLTGRLRAAVPAAGLWASGLYASLAQRAAAGWSRLLSDPPTAVDALAHRTRLDALVLEGQKVVLLAHSQGNLFANAAFDQVAARAPRAVAAVHVAPASVTLRGPHVLADIDLVIQALRVQGLSGVPPANLRLPAVWSDPTGHALVGTYLDPHRAGRQRVASLLLDAFDQLAAPAPGSEPGLFSATLTWDGPGDLDLHVTEPSGAQVFHAQRQGPAGRLDADNRLANGPERYIARCEDALRTPGTYRIGLNHFAGAEGRRATLQVAVPASGERVSRTVDVGPAAGRAGEAAPVPLAEVVVRREPDGRWTTTVQ